MHFLQASVSVKGLQNDKINMVVIFNLMSRLSNSPRRSSLKAFQEVCVLKANPAKALWIRVDSVSEDMSR